MNFIKTNFLTVILLGLVVLLFILTKPFGCGNNKPSVVTTHDTQYVAQPPVYIPQYIPTQTSSQQPIIIPPQYIPSTNSDELLKQYIEVTNKYLAVNTYKDSIQLKDSSGNRVGVVNLEDVVSENQLKSRKPSYQLTFPHYYTTTTITNPPKNQFFIGGGLTGNQAQIINGVNVGLIWKNKKDQLYGIHAGAISLGNVITPEFEISTYWKIKLGK